MTFWDEYRSLREAWQEIHDLEAEAGLEPDRRPPPPPFRPDYDLIGGISARQRRRMMAEDDP